MKVKIIYSFSYDKLEERINSFLGKNEDKIEVIDIKWKTFIEHYVMIVYKIK
ncbi:hypothetical protein GOQ27_03675 [Clostridium sp. D2Q-11]|uniref:Uncharacterized protein n=1 Tax=Anaeromonas frigoriresistens TaxID=2683708 RepID=A0A942Z5K8_9FIRM|nr:hypothetical protein [Anaeromonas frigoriresistens]MBS4537546.1 hypothetical protein [Anaeromonas frigoriresistens]